MTGPALEARIVVRRDAFELGAELVIEQGGTVALLGANGAGKSTTVAALAGLVPLDAGRIVVSGRVLDDPEHSVFIPTERRPIGAMLQQTALFPHLSVLDNVAFGLRAGGMRRVAARATARDALDAAGLAGLADRRPRELSGGQGARVALVRTLVRRPSLLLLDEPLAAVDAGARQDLRTAIRAALTSFSGAALIVTHDAADAEALADEVVVLDGGRVLQRGALAAVRADPATPLVARIVA